MILYIITSLALSVILILSEKRLEAKVIPEHYDVDIWINTESSPKTLNGTVCIQINCTNECVKIINLHSKEKYGLRIVNTEGISVEKVPIKKGKGEVKKENEPKIIKVESWNYESESDILSISLSDKLQPRELYKLCIKYEGQITEDNDYLIWDKNEKYIIATNFKRQAAFPCFDEPNLRATFTVKLTTQPKIHSLSNVIEYKEIKNPAWVQRTYELKEKFPPSQISFVVSNFELAIYCLPFSRQWTACLNSEQKYGEERIDYQTVKHYMYRMATTYMSLGPSWYSFPKVQFIVVPTEKKTVSFNWGLVTISKTELHNGPEDRRMYNFYLRLSSTMFGGMISPDSWDSSWLYTALAEYIAYVQMPWQPYLTKVIPTLMWERPSENVYINMEKGLDVYRKETTGKNKGVLMLRMIHSFMGESNFITSIRGFINNYKFKSVAPDQLWETFTKKTKGKLPQGSSWSTIVEKWTQQTSYPVVTIEAIGGGKFRVTQEPFFGSYQDRINPNLSGSQDSNKCWMFPLSYTFFDTRLTTAIKTKKQNKKIKTNWLDCNKELTLEAESEQFIPFTEYTGMYRVKYDKGTWEKIVSFLPAISSLIDVPVRAQIVHDAFALAWVGYQDYENVFSLHPYLKYEGYRLVWKAFFSGASDLRDTLITSPKTYRSFQVFINSTMHELFPHKYYVWPYKTSEDAALEYWTCIIGRNERCRNIVIKTFNYYMGNRDWLYSSKTTDIDRSMYTVGFCTVLMEKQKYDDDWTEKVDFILDLLFNKRILVYREVYFDVLRCITDEEVIKRLLNWASSPSSDTARLLSKASPDTATKEEKQLAFLDIAQGQDSFLPTLNYFYENFDKIQSYHESYEFVARIISVLTPRMNQEQVGQMETFIESKTELEKEEVIQRALDEGRAAAILRTAWLKENDSHIRTLLTTKYCTSEDCNN